MIIYFWVLGPSSRNGFITCDVYHSVKVLVSRILYLTSSLSRLSKNIPKKSLVVNVNDV